MSNKLVIILATITTLISATAISTSAFAAPHGGHGGHGAHWKGPHFNHHHYRHWNVRYRYGVAPVVYAAARPATCLTKEYTPEGAVLFKDICTAEWAMNPPVPMPAPQAR